MAGKRYRARVTIDGKQIHLGYFTTARERKQAEAEALANQRETVQARERGGERFETFAARTLQARKRKVAHSTWVNYNLMAQRWILPTFGRMRLRDITVRDVDEWFASLPPAPSNAQRYAVLSLIMRRAVKEGEIDRSPCMTEGVASVKSKPRPTWSWTDFQMLVDAAADAQESALLHVLAGSGARIGEVLALDWGDVDFDNGEITISKHLGRGTAVLPGTKAHPDQVRILALPSAALSALLRLFQTTQGLQEGPVFLNSRGGRLSYSVAFERFKSLRASRGLDDLHLHDLRHLHLTAFAQHATLAETMERGGHADYRSALRYQHSSRERQRAIVAAMEDAK
ncbi:tyrosine-type recombinase/integrase [Microbacterium sp. MTN4-26]|uniref:tyrosine-type recombinase/integrase n=1 Tax=unclassified Microbacterium TaxID=2609290 RepID=UPI0036F2D4BB